MNGSPGVPYRRVTPENKASVPPADSKQPELPAPGSLKRRHSFVAEARAPRQCSGRDFSEELNEAVLDGRADRVRQLLADVPESETDLAGLLALAVDRGHADVVMAIVGSPCATHDVRMAALHHAAASGREQIAQQLLDAGVPVDVKDSCGFTPLMNAAGNGQSDIVRLLLAAGADPAAHAQSAWETPIWLAFRGGHTGTVRVLAGSNPSLAQSRHGPYGPSLMVQVVMSNNSPMLKALLDCGADVLGQRYTALDAAVDGRRCGLVRMLLEQAHRKGVLHAAVECAKERAMKIADADERDLMLDAVAAAKDRLTSGSRD